MAFVAPSLKTFKTSLPLPSLCIYFRKIKNENTDLTFAHTVNKTVPRGAYRTPSSVSAFHKGRQSRSN